MSAAEHVLRCGHHDATETAGSPVGRDGATAEVLFGLSPSLRQVSPSAYDEFAAAQFAVDHGTEYRERAKAAFVLNSVPSGADASASVSSLGEPAGRVR